jgi:hypothetical protein
VLTPSLGNDNTTSTQQSDTTCFPRRSTSGHSTQLFTSSRVPAGRTLPRHGSLTRDHRTRHRTQDPHNGTSGRPPHMPPRASRSSTMAITSRMPAASQSCADSDNHSLSTQGQPHWQSGSHCLLAPALKSAQSSFEQRSAHSPVHTADRACGSRALCGCRCRGNGSCHAAIQKRVAPPADTLRMLGGQGPLPP